MASRTAVKSVNQRNCGGIRAANGYDVATQCEQYYAVRNDGRLVPCRINNAGACIGRGGFTCPSPPPASAPAPLNPMCAELTTRIDLDTVGASNCDAISAANGYTVATQCTQYYKSRKNGQVTMCSLNSAQTRCLGWNNMDCGDLAAGGGGGGGGGAPPTAAPSPVAASPSVIAGTPPTAAPSPVFASPSSSNGLTFEIAVNGDVGYRSSPLIASHRIPSIGFHWLLPSADPRPTQVDSFDRYAFIRAVAAAAGVTYNQINLIVSPASIRVTVTAHEHSLSKRTRSGPAIRHSTGPRLAL